MEWGPDPDEDGLAHMLSIRSSSEIARWGGGLTGDVIQVDGSDGSDGIVASCGWSRGEPGMMFLKA